MKFSESWLREWVNPALSSDELAHQITMAGLEVDGVDPVAGEFTGVIIGEVVECGPHPDADKLQVTKINLGDFGDGELVDIVCGAKNCRQGLKVAVATVGAVLPGNFKIKKAKLRGVPSFGMLCSESEIGLAESADGIMELAESAVLGTDFREFLGLDDYFSGLALCLIEWPEHAANFIPPADLELSIRYVSAQEKSNDSLAKAKSETGDKKVEQVFEDQRAVRCVATSAAGDLVLQALLMAIWRRKPENKILVHSDQGSQFTSIDWASFLKHHNLEHSMSRRGNCHDNAVAESFFNLLKRERIRRRTYKTREDARSDVFDYIEMFYNPKRKHVRNGMLSPADFERQQQRKLQGV